MPRRKGRTVVVDGTVYSPPWFARKVDDPLRAAIKHHSLTGHPMGGFGRHAECEDCQIVWYSGEPDE